MIPIVKLSNLYLPKVTIFLNDSLSITKNKLKEILIDFDDNDKLFEMILSKFGFYEIICGDVFTFYKIFKDVYKEYRDYYHEMLVNYRKAYDYSIGNRRRTIRHDESSSDKDSNRSADSSDVNDIFNLPNKQVENPEGYLTSRNKDIFTENGTYHEDNDHTYDSSVDVIYDNEFLDLKRKYLNQIRNVYSEFADKFIDCFIQVYN